VNSFQSLRDYEHYLYSLSARCPDIRGSTLVLIRRGTCTAIVQGELILCRGYRLTVYERLSSDAGTVAIEDFGYELWHGSEKLAWHDSQPHPDDLSLKPTYPHHRHVHPDIKHNRVPAPGMSFTSPNLHQLIAEVSQFAADPTDA
jgi:hypothetical protein